MRECAGTPFTEFQETDRSQHGVDLIPLLAVQAGNEGGPDCLVGVHRQFQIFEHTDPFKHRRPLKLTADHHLRDLGLTQTQQIDGLAEER